VTARIAAQDTRGYPGAPMRRGIALLLAVAAACMKAPDPSAMQGGASPAAAAPRVAFDAPADWTAVAPDQDFYLAKWEVAGGGAATLSWLGAGGGAEFIAANVQRWLGEWERDGGGAIGDYSFDTLPHGGRKVHRMELGGTLQATRQVGGGEPRAGWRLFGAVVETESGPLFLKFIGPAEVVARGAEACWDALAALRLE
jgi:hypothetical protein